MLAQSFLQLALLAADPAVSSGMLTQLFLKLTLVGAEWVLWVLVLLSFVSVGIIVDRVWYFCRAPRRRRRLAANLEQFLRQGDLKSAWQRSPARTLSNASSWPPDWPPWDAEPRPAARRCSVPRRAPVRGWKPGWRF